MTKAINLCEQIKVPEEEENMFLLIGLVAAALNMIFGVLTGAYYREVKVLEKREKRRKEHGTRE